MTRINVTAFKQCMMKKKRMLQAAGLTTSLCCITSKCGSCSPTSLNAMHTHPFATHTQKYACNLQLLRLRRTFILGQYLPKAKAGRDHSPCFCCFLLSGSPNGSTSAHHPHPAQAPQSWPCRTRPIRKGPGAFTVQPRMQAPESWPCRRRPVKTGSGAFNPKTSSVTKRRPFYSGNLSSDTPGDSRQAFLHWGDVISINQSIKQCI